MLTSILHSVGIVRITLRSMIEAITLPKTWQMISRSVANLSFFLPKRCVANRRENLSLKSKELQGTIALFQFNYLGLPAIAHELNTIKVHLIYTRERKVSTFNTKRLLDRQEALFT